MVQRKGNLPVKDSRSSKERAQGDPYIMATVSMVRVPTAPPALGDLPHYWTEGPEESEPELISLSQTCQGTKFSREKAPTRAGQHTLQKGTPSESRARGPAHWILWAHAPFSTSDLLNQKNSERTRVYPFRMDEECTRVFESLKLFLASAPALGLPNLLKPFQLYIHERQGIAPGVLIQMLTDILEPIAYLSRKLYHTAQRCPACLGAMIATYELLQEAENFPWDSLSPFMYPTKCWARCSKWKFVIHCWKKGQVPSYSWQSQHLPQNCKLNPASLLPESDSAVLIHDFAEIIDEV